MRRISITAISFLVLLLSVSSTCATPAHRHATKCPTVRSHLLAANNRALLYIAPEPGGGSPEVFGCAVGRRPYILGLVPN